MIDPVEFARLSLESSLKMKAEQHCYTKVQMDLPALAHEYKPLRSLIESEEALTASLAYILNKQCAANDLILCDQGIATVFHAHTVPSVQIGDYVRRVGKFAACSNVCLLAALVYIDRVRSAHPFMNISSLNIHRLYITAVTCAVKFFDDIYYRNSFYACIGGLPASELNTLEVKFLRLINYRLFITKEEIDRVQAALISEVMACRDPKAHEVQKILRAEGCVRSYSLFEKMVASELSSEGDIVYNPAECNKSHRPGAMNAIGEDRPRKNKWTACAPPIYPGNILWMPYDGRTSWEEKVN
mmetsp:Transcript_9094/g.27362  ORF Transcript_9094/g.27362 Transcript_9094/m.27362 type:complete len:300 (-) Transcript_9094:171-1070(-)